MEKKCVFVSHLGLGDNITMSSAVRYLINFYDKIYVIAKNRNLINVKMLYGDILNIIVVGINEQNEKKEIINYIKNIDDETDIFVSGFCHKSYLKNKIRNQLLNNKITNDNNNIKFKYKFVVDFYTDINLDFNIYYDYFKLPETKKSTELFDEIKEFNIIFIHTKSSNKEININIDEYFNDNKYFIVCANKNIYNIDSNKYELANKFVNIPILDYSTIILNAKIIKVIDSCFCCMILPLMKKEKYKLSAISIDIIDR